MEHWLQNQLKAAEGLLEAVDRTAKVVKENTSSKHLDVTPGTPLCTSSPTIAHRPTTHAESLGAPQGPSSSQALPSKVHTHDAAIQHTYHDYNHTGFQHAAKQTSNAFGPTTQTRTSQAIETRCSTIQSTTSWSCRYCCTCRARAYRDTCHRRAITNRTIITNRTLSRTVNCTLSRTSSASSTACTTCC